MAKSDYRFPKMPQADNTFGGGNGKKSKKEKKKEFYNQNPSKKAKNSTASPTNYDITGGDKKRAEQGKRNDKNRKIRATF
jgi:hypothetical protein